MSDDPRGARVLIVDLSASIGTRALQSMLPEATTTGPWLGLPMAGMPGDLHLDWFRPASVEDLPPAGQAYLGRYAILGPGAASMLPALLQRWGDNTAAEDGCLLAPNALIESMALRGRLPSTRPDAVTLQLPSSDSQALWMILLEQIDSLLRRTQSFFRVDPSTSSGGPAMSSNLKHSMDLAMSIEGAVAVALVDHRSGMCLGQAGGGMNLEVAAAGNTEVVRAKLRTIEALGLRNTIEDILITLQHQYHLIRLIPANPGLFLYLALDRQRGNLALARYKLTEIERGLKV